MIGTFFLLLHKLAEGKGGDLRGQSQLVYDRAERGSRVGEVLVQHTGLCG